MTKSTVVSVGKQISEVFTVERISLWNRMAVFFAFYRPSKFELDLLSTLLSDISKMEAEIMRTQISMFSRLIRVLQWEYGFVIFSCEKNQKGRMPKLNDRPGANIFKKITAVCESGKLVRCSIYVVDGFLMRVTFTSKGDYPYPDSSYYFSAKVPP